MKISHDFLRSILNYSPETGLFEWKISKGTKKVGSIAGAINRTGYFAITIDKHRYLSHRLAWFYFYGVWPNEDVDHKNRVRTDNRIANLRLASKSQNQFNSSIRKDNTSGYKGVYYCAREGKYLAQIMVNRKRISLGYHTSAIDAHRAYQKASLTYHGEFSSEQ